MSSGSGVGATADTWSSTRDVRWVHVDATDTLDRLTLLQLAVKYHLHPLAVDDIIDNRTPTKLDRFQDHQFVSIDILTLAAYGDAEKALNEEEVGQFRVRVTRSNVSMFLSTQNDTLLT